jgi:hypothetical protein
MRAGRALFLLSWLALAGGCTTLDSDRPTGWTCRREIKDGELSADGIRLLYIGGRQRGMSEIWSWRGVVDGVWWSFYDKRESEARPPVLSVSLQVSKDVHRRTVSAEFSLQDGTRRVPVALNRGLVSGFDVRSSSEMLLDLGGYGPVVLSGFDKSGAVTFRSEVNMDAIRRGRQAMAEIRQSLDGMVRNYREACQGDYDMRDVVIT